ncbi:MAG TPA: hypothetical protein VLG71_00940 [Candidatus Limnocylindria bacterium]|nr:hypothetical protein [Candidatus Limnocylindria bacterium]
MKHLRMAVVLGLLFVGSNVQAASATVTGGLVGDPDMVAYVQMQRSGVSRPVALENIIKMQTARVDAITKQEAAIDTALANVMNRSFLSHTRRHTVLSSFLPIGVDILTRAGFVSGPGLSLREFLITTIVGSIRNGIQYAAISRTLDYNRLHAALTAS